MPALRILLFAALFVALAAPFAAADPADVESVQTVVDLGPHASCAFWRRAVKRGDTLMGMARAELGDATRWKEITLLNEGLDPASLEIGRVLVMPPKNPPADAAARYDFFRGPGDGSPPIVPFVPGDAMRTGAEGGHRLYAVQHAHLTSFLDGIADEATVAAVVEAMKASGRLAIHDIPSGEAEVKIVAIEGSQVRVDAPVFEPPAADLPEVVEATDIDTVIIPRMGIEAVPEAIEEDPSSDMPVWVLVALMAVIVVVSIVALRRLGGRGEDGPVD